MSYCCVSGCTNRGTQEGLKFYRIPRGSRPFQSNRRRLWLQAIKREDWAENTINNARVCSAHFISGEASLDFQSPDFVPSVFVSTKQSKRPEAKMERKRRRDDREPVQPGPCDTPEQGEPSMENCQGSSQRIMTGNSCCVKNCHQFSHDEDGESVKSGVSFFSFPAWRRNEGGEISALTKRRRAAWVAVIGRSDITFDHIPTSTRVCSQHFHSGKPAYERLESDPDWAPSLELGHDEGSGKFAERFHQSNGDKEPKKKKTKEKKIIKKKKELKKRRLETSIAPIEEEEAAAGGGDANKRSLRGFVNDSHPWSEVRSLFLSVLKNEPISSQRPTDQTHKGAMHVGKEADFKDFFRKSLEESLENFSKSRTPSAQEPPIYVELKEDLSLRILPVETTGKDSSSSSSPSCGSCVRLRRKVVELQEELSLLSGVQEDVDVTPVAETTQLHKDQDPQSPETVQAEEEVSDWLESPKRNKKRQKLSPSSHNPDNTNSPKDKPRSIQRFRKAWLRMFDFLRYSPSLNVMWCHICRLYHDKKHRDNGMIKGSRCLKLDNIKNHSISMYHKKNMERHRKHMSDPNSLDSNWSNRSSEENSTSNI